MLYLYNKKPVESALL